jgi:unsaturated rhamnogalacturonyl hydrolase
VRPHTFRLIVPVMLVGFICATARAADPWGAWPDGKAPKQVGKRLAVNLIERKTYMVGKNGGLQYPEVCTAYGALRFANTIGDKELVDKLIARYAMIVTDNPNTPDGKTLIQRPVNVDASVFGIVPFEIYLLNRDEKYLALAKKSADAQWEKPQAKDPPTTQMANWDKGLTSQTRFWIDDMFMITSLQLQAYRATRDKMYLDRTALEMVAYLDKLQQPNGLFYHGEGAEFYWGRGDGWVAVGMAELLLSLPEDHPQRARVVEGYKKMMAALLKYQGEDGMWHQLIDQPDSWAETSCTGMFTFAIATGVKQGWLDAAQYKEPVRKAWIALVGYLDADANLKEVCIGTNKNFSTKYYLDRPREVGNLHGQAAAIWAAWALLD